ncbi:MAG: TrpR-like protein [Oscillospiraceae bacterium]|nr:TrpR-like protein [Oscillospiraceae bacterium]
MNKNVKNLKKARYENLYKAILTLETVDECMKFFDDLCSVTEIYAMEQRFQVAEMLSEGHNYNSILDQVGASSATISRVNRSLMYGADGYAIAFERMGIGEHKSPAPEGDEEK